jgi:hypothetical protein
VSIRFASANRRHEEGEFQCRFTTSPSRPRAGPCSRETIEAKDESAAVAQVIEQNRAPEPEIIEIQEKTAGEPAK